MTQHADTIPEARPSRAAIALGYEMAMREAADELERITKLFPHNDDKRVIYNLVFALRGKAEEAWQAVKEAKR